jgi:hypothetical protein
MELILAATAIFVIASPFINAAINKVNWSPKTKSLVAWGVAIVIATAYVLVTAGVGNLYQLFIAAPAIYGYSQAVYQFFVKNIATKFEAITSPGAIVVAASDEAGKVDITSDATIKATGDNVTVDPPVQVTAAPVEIIPEADVRG